MKPKHWALKQIEDVSNNREQSNSINSAFQGFLVLLCYGLHPPMPLFCRHQLQLADWTWTWCIFQIKITRMKFRKPILALTFTQHIFSVNGTQFSSLLHCIFTLNNNKKTKYYENAHFDFPFLMWCHKNLLDRLKHNRIPNDIWNVNCQNVKWFCDLE